MNLQLNFLKFIKKKPSYPYIPMPIFAYLIILTSFPPSPTASTIFFNLYLTVLTIKAFWAGVDLYLIKIPINNNGCQFMNLI